MDYLDKLEQERAADAAAQQQNPQGAPPPPLPTGQFSPAALQYATPHAAPQARAVGLAQRRIMIVILGAILLICSMTSGAIITPGAGNPMIQTAVIAVLMLARLAILAMMMIGVYQLAAALGATMTARVLYVLAMLLPLISLIVLLVVNQQATALLRRHGIRVGLMGAKLADLPAA